MANVPGQSEPNSIPEPVIARFLWTEDELQVALRNYYQHAGWRFARLGLICLCGVAMLASLVIFATWNVPEDFAVIPVVSGIVLICLLASRGLTVSRYSVRRQFRKRPDQNVDLEWRFGPDEIQTRSSLGESRFNWSAFVKVIKTPEGLLLYSLTNFFQWLPRHAFESDADFQRVTTWAQQKVPVQGERCDYGARDST